MSMVVKNMDDLEHLDESELEELYSWVDKIPLSRPKRNIARDFSDGVMIAELLKHFLPHLVSLHNYTPANSTKMKLDNWKQLNRYQDAVLIAEVVKHFLPKMVDIHNYTPGSSTPQKMQNWFLLNRKVFSKLNFQLTEDLIRELSVGKAGLIERFLMHLRAKVERAIWDMQKGAGERKEQAKFVSKSSQRLHTNPKGLKGQISDQPEADQNISMPQLTYAGMAKSEGNQQVSPGRVKQAPVAQKGNAKIKSLEELIPRSIYEEKEQECLAKEETIQILQAKVRRLEHLLHLKDIRIEDLQGRLETTRPTGKGIR